MSIAGGSFPSGSDYLDVATALGRAYTWFLFFTKCIPTHPLCKYMGILDEPFAREAALVDSVEDEEAHHSDHFNTHFRMRIGHIGSGNPISVRKKRPEIDYKKLWRNLLNKERVSKHRVGERENPHLCYATGLIPHLTLKRPKSH